MEKEFNNKEFKQTRLIIVLVSIIVILVFVIGFLLGTRTNKTNKPIEKTIVENKDDKTKKHKEKQSDEDISEYGYEFKEWQIEEFDKLKDKADVYDINNIPDYTSESYGLPKGLCSIGINLDEKDIYLKDLSSLEKMSMLASYARPKKAIGDNNIMGISTFNEEYAKLFFEDISFLKKIDDKEYPLFYPYSITYRDNKYYVLGKSGGCTISDEIGLNVSYIDFRKEDKYIIKSYETYYFDIEADDNNTHYKYYKDKAQKELLYEYTDDEEPKKDNIKYNTYDMYFDTSNGNFKLEKILFNRN